jgi:tRNA pseudouridine65 synthase
MPADAPTILHLDDAVVAVDKPAGLVVHRGWADDEVALLQLVRDRIGAYVWPVHRLDRGASGALLLARAPEHARALQAQWTVGAVSKRYLAIVRGNPPDAQTIDHPVPRAEDGPRVPAVTEIRTLHRAGRYAVVAAAPRTGRLHQIRRHLKHISCPLIGDVRYGKGEHNRHFRTCHDLHRLALHARVLALTHPVTGAPLVIAAPVPDDLARAILGLGAPASLLQDVLEDMS